MFPVYSVTYVPGCSSLAEVAQSSGSEQREHDADKECVPLDTQQSALCGTELRTRVCARLRLERAPCRRDQPQDGVGEEHRAYEGGHHWAKDHQEAWDKYGRTDAVGPE